LRSRILRYLTLLVVLEISACTSRVPYDPFKVPRDEIESRIKTVALTPLQLPRDIEDPESVRATFRQLIESRMRAGGFTIIPDADFEARWDQASQEVGGLYDPMTGTYDKEKGKQVYDKVMHAMASDHVDALLIVKVVPANAPFGGGWAHWDGAQQQIRPGGFWSNVFLGSVSGTVEGLSLIASMRDMDDRLLFVNAGGIQLLTTLSTGGHFVRVPVSQLLKDPERNATAVALALGPLTGNVTPTSGDARPHGTPTPPAGS
jgi:hypothetical protein